MRIRQIGTLVFDANTNIVVDANNQDAPGVGFRVNDLYDPQPFAAEIAFRRATRQQALNAVSAFARELHSYAQRRRDNLPAVAGGALVVVEDANGGTTLRSYLRDAVVTLLSVEATSTGVLARVRVTGTLISTFVDYTFVVTAASSLKPYERREVTLVGSNDAYLYKNGINQTFINMPGLYNALLAVEELESATGTSRIQAISPASVSSGITMQNQSWDAGWQTLTRANFSSATSGTITYTIPTSPRDIYRLFIEIYCPMTPPSSARYIVSWNEQPQIAETISVDRSWYTPALIALDTASFPLTLEIQNVPTGTLVMPIVLLPIDGVYVFNIISPPTLTGYRAVVSQTAGEPPFKVFPSGTVYGPPGFVSSRYVAVFNGAMSPSLSGAVANVGIYSYRIEPAAFA